ncbi:hypothetical protein BDR04DRAFT_1095516 [Suillus decipiens]|nr:hypothetical protein BDR04DRAFT_1095516 [Suillus decipiens]
MPSSTPPLSFSLLPKVTAFWCAATKCRFRRCSSECQCIVRGVKRARSTEFSLTLVLELGSNASMVSTIGPKRANRVSAETDAFVICLRALGAYGIVWVQTFGDLCLL